MMKVLLVFGTRPEAIKMAPLFKELERHSKLFETKICVTAQHRVMLDKILEFYEVKPDFDLDLMAPNQSLTELTSKILLGIEGVFKIFLPDLMLVHGDTTTSMAAAMAGFYNRVRLGHVEAGLRTYNLDSPWPEEMNRQITDRICDIYFAPTVLSKSNLINEKISESKIFVTGNTVIDSLKFALSKIEKDDNLSTELLQQISECGYDLKPILNKSREFILITGHRRENFGAGFENICQAIKEIAIQFPLIDIVYPVHLNPNVQKPVYSLLSSLENVFLLPPLDYLPFIFLLKQCKFVITDSGGIQEEAPSLGKPVLVIRNTTERPEAVEAGTVKLIGTETGEIVLNIMHLINSSLMFEEMSKAHNPYGDGFSSKRIADAIINEFIKK